MNTKVWSVFLGLVAIQSSLPCAEAATTGTVARDAVNVRAKASLGGEVITQLHQGEPVTLLSEILVSQPKPDEPARWWKIALPAKIPVWVHASYIDAASKTVLPKRLNVRAGPGENYGVIGRLERGDVVKDIRLKDAWMEIEAPTNAYAFVAAELVDTNAPDAPATGSVAETPPSAAPETTPPVEPATEATTTNALATSTDAPPTTPESTNVVNSSPEVTPDPTAEPAASDPPKVETPAVAAASTNETPAVEPAASASSAETSEPSLGRRMVRREGVIAGTASIHAPSYYELRNQETGRAMNYLHTTSTNIPLHKLRGRRVVVVGEESLDARWPRTPVLEIDAVEIVP